MVSINCLRERTAEYLRSHVFNTDDVYTESNGLLVPNSVIGYREMQEGVSIVDSSWIAHRVLEWARNSEEYVVIDIASGFGSGYTRQLVEQYPNVRIFLVDNLSDGLDIKAAERWGRSGDELDLLKHFSKGDSMNDILQKAGYKNINYINRCVGARKTITHLSDLDEVTRNRHVLVTAICSPGRTSFIAAREAVYHGAEKCFIVPAALECMMPQDIVDFLGDESLLSDEELDILSKMNYRVSVEPAEQKRVALKQMIVLEIAYKMRRYFETSVHLYPNTSGEYNEPDHLIAGNQIAVMERPEIPSDEIYDGNFIGEIMGQLVWSIFRSSG